MSLNIRALKDAVARWQTYEDRGIKPHYQWGNGGNGDSCALGDIFHHERLSGSSLQEKQDNTCYYLGSPIVGLDEYFPFQQGTSTPRQKEYDPYPGLYWLAAVNDSECRWPIEEVQRLIAWEEASIKADNIADVEQPIFV